MSEPAEFGIDLDAVRERIKALQYFVSVTDVRSAVEAIEEEFATTPAAFVSVASETGGPNIFVKGAGGHSQLIECTLSVLFVEQAARFDRLAPDQVEQTRKALIRQLTAWTPAGAARALEYDRYLPRASGGGLFWGECLFRTRYRLTI